MQSMKQIGILILTLVLSATSFGLECPAQLKYSNGVTLKDSYGRFFYNNGTTLKDSYQRLFYGDGTTFKDSYGRYFYSNAATILDSYARLFYPNGTTLLDSYARYFYSDGTTLKDSYQRFFHKNGTTARDSYGRLFRADGSQTEFPVQLVENYQDQVEVNFHVAKETETLRLDFPSLGESDGASLHAHFRDGKITAHFEIETGHAGERVEIMFSPGDEEDCSIHSGRL